MPFRVDTKYRKRVLRGKIVIRLRQLFYEASRINQWLIRDMNLLATGYLRRFNSEIENLRKAQR